MRVDAVTNAEKSLEEVPGAGLDFVEIVVDGPESGPESLRKKSGAVEEFLESSSMDLFFHLPWQTDLGSPLDKVRQGGIDALIDILEIGKELGVERAVVHPKSFTTLYWDEDRIRENILKSITSIDKTAKNLGIELVVENAENFEIGDFDEVFDETETKMCLDTGHAVLDGFDEEDIVNFVEENEERISHFHLNDNRKNDDGHLPLGYGFIDLERIIQGLKEVGWDCSLSIELFTRSSDYLEISRRKLDVWLGD